MHYLDNTDSNKVHVQQGDVKIAFATDNAFVGTRADVDLIDPQLHRCIQLKKSNSLTTVVWNPWYQGAAQLGDLGDSEWMQFLCVEASNILTATVGLAPGEEQKMTAVLNVGKL